MAASTEQKVDFLLKKLGYSSSKTGIAEDESSLSGTKKAPFAEPIPSPLVVPDSSVWSNSEWIPTTPPGSDTSYVKTYLASASGFRMTEDTTVSGSRSFVARTTYGNNSTANLKNWIDTQFGADYVIRVYKGDPNSGGVQLSAAGAGSNDTWFFDYSSGVLNFNGDQIPSGVTSSNVYIVGYRYIGETGVLTPGDDFETRNLNVTGIATVAGSTDLNGNLDVAGITTLVGNVNANSDVIIAGNLTVNGTETTLNTNSLEVEDINIGIASASPKLNDAQINGAGITIYSSGGDKTLTWDNGNSRMAFSHNLYAPNATVGTDLTVGGNLNVTGDVVYDEVTGRNIKISGVGTITQLNVTGLNVSGVSTFNANVHLLDNDVLRFGDTGDLQISHNGTDSIIKDAGAGRLKILGGFQVKNVSDTETLITANQSGASATNVELYHSNIKRFETISTGATVTGDLGVSGNVLVGGALTVTGTTTFNGGTLTLGDADTDNVVFGGEVDSNILPDDDNTFDLGSSAKRWKDVYAANFHGDGSNLTNTGASLSAASGTQRLVVTNLTSGTMTTAATDSDLVFIAPHNLLSLNGNLSVTGVATFTGPITAGSSLGADGQYMRRTGTGVTWSSFPTLRTTTSFTATANQTSFTWSHNVNFLDVFLNGVKLSPSEYTANGSAVVLNSGCFAGDIVELYSYNTASTFGGGGGGSSTLPGLSDVTISSANAGQVLKYNGTAWVNDTDATSASGLLSQNATGIHTLSNVGIGTTTASYGLTVAEGNISRFDGNVQVGTGATVGIGSTAYVHKLALKGVGSEIHLSSNGGSNLVFSRGNEIGVLGTWGPTGLKVCGNGVAQSTPPDINTQFHVLNSGNCTVKFQGGSMSAVGLHFLNGGYSGGAGHHILSTHDFKIIMASGPDSGDPNRTVGMWRRYSTSNAIPNMGYESYGRYIFKPGISSSTTLEIDHLSGGIDASGIITASQFSGPVINDNSDIQTRNLKVLGITTFSGNVSIAGTLTYEDVTHVDSTGISTFNDGVHVSGIVTAKPGAAVTYYGDGSNLTGIAAGSLDDGTDIRPRNIIASGITTVGFATATDVWVSGAVTATTFNGLLTGNSTGLQGSPDITVNSATIGSLGISTIAGSWSASAGVGKTINSFDIATDDFKTAEYTLWFNYSSGGVSNIQSQKLLVMQDGTTPYSQEFAIMSAPNKIVSVGASMTGTIVNINATPESGISGVTTYKLARNTLL